MNIKCDMSEILGVNEDVTECEIRRMRYRMIRMNVKNGSSGRNLSEIRKVSEQT